MLISQMQTTAQARIISIQSKRKVRVYPITTTEAKTRVKSHSRPNAPMPAHNCRSKSSTKSQNKHNYSSNPHDFNSKQKKGPGLPNTIILQTQSAGPQVFRFRKWNRPARKCFDLANAIGRPALMLILQTQSADTQVF